MFPMILKQNGQKYDPYKMAFTESSLKEFLLQNPYDIYAVVNENLDNQSEPILTTFLVLYAKDFEHKVILYDVSRERHTTITTDIFSLAKGYVEIIDVGHVDRYPLQFYTRVVEEK